MKKGFLRIAKPDAYYVKLSSIEFFTNCALMACICFQTVYLQSIGTRVETIGIINAINTMLGAFGSLFWGFMGDKLRSTKKVYLTCMIIASVLYVIMPLLGFVASIFAVMLIPFGNFFRAPPFMGLADTMVIGEAQKTGLNFGSIRMWGTVGYVLMGFLLSPLAKVFGISIGFYAFGVVGLLAIIITMTAVKPAAMTKADAHPVPLKEMKLGRLFKNYYYVVYLIYVFFAGLCTNTSLTIMPYFVEDIGLSVTIMATITAVQSMLEIPLLFFSNQMHKKAGLPILVVGHGLFHMLRFFLFTQVHNYTALVIVNLLQGISTGIEFGCSTNYVYQLAPEGLKSTAYMLKGFTGSAAGIIANLASGFLVTALGVRNVFYLMSGVMCFGLLFFIAAQLLGEKVFKQVLPEAVKRQKMELR